MNRYRYMYVDDVLNDGTNGEKTCKLLNACGIVWRNGKAITPDGLRKEKRYYQKYSKPLIKLFYNATTLQFEIIITTAAIEKTYHHHARPVSIDGFFEGF